MLRWVLVLLAAVSACGQSDSGSTPIDGGAGTGGVSTGGGGSPACTPHQQIACACGSDVNGYQACLADGSGYEPCVCPDAGTGGTSGSAGASGDAGASGSSGSTGATGGTDGGVCKAGDCPVPQPPAQPCCLSQTGPCGVDFGGGLGCQPPCDPAKCPAPAPPASACCLPDTCGVDHNLGNGCQMTGCPAQAPTNGSSCTPALFCDYGSVSCFCLSAQWACG